MSASGQDAITIEAQRLEGFGRIIVTFEDRMVLPAHEVRSENGVLIVDFDTPMSGVLPDIGTPLADYIAIARFDPDMRGLRMGLKGPTQINTIEAGEQLYIDLLPPNWVGLPPSLPAEIIDRLARRAEDAARIAEERRRAEMVAEFDPSASIRVGRHPTFTRVQFDWTVGTKASFSQQELAAEITFDWPVPIDLFDVLSDMGPEITSLENQVQPSGSRVLMEVAEGVGLRFYEESSTRFILDIDRAGEPDGVDIATLEAELEQETAAAADAVSPAPISEASPIAVVAQQDLTPFVTSEGGTVRVVFPFTQDTPAAVFRRGNIVWMLFDTSATINPLDTRNEASFSTLVGDFSVQGAGAAKIVRMALDEDRLATLGSEGRSWVLSLGEVLLAATEPVVLNRRQNATGLYEMTADLVQPHSVHQFRDPDVGDILEVVTIYPPARGMVRNLDFVDFSAPRTIHGLVVRPLHEGVSVALEDKLAVVTSTSGLTLSPAQELRFRTPVESRVSAMNLMDHLAASPDQFYAQRDEILLRIMEAEGRELDRTRLDLAQFYLANNLGHEALGILSVLGADLRQASLKPAIDISRAAANTIAGRSSEALDLLSSELLRDEADAMLWRTIANAQLGNYAAARLDALGAAPIVDNYPNWLRSLFQLSAIRAAIESQDTALATNILTDVDLSVLQNDQVSEYELLSGMLDEANGRSAEALESYGRVITADRRSTTGEAVLRTIEMLDRMGQLDVPRAVDTLSVQAAIWRGGGVELDVVRKLTELQYRNGDFRDAFQLTREAAGLYQDTQLLNDLVAQARSEFAGLYLDGGADALDTVEALSIYYDYRQLTPPGADGDLMIRNLAQRLIKVDLLAQAAELLQYQVDNRLEGAARAQVAADLAVVHIANRNPAMALQVLHQTRLAGLPPGLERQRRVLEASALINANRQDLAIDLLSSLSGRDTELLRIDAMWKGGRYREASERIELLYSPDLDRGDLSPVARNNIVKAAVGYVLDNDQIGLSRLRSRYADAMSTAPEWPMFAFVTDNVEVTGREFREIARQIAAVDSLNAFLNAYREVYTASSAITPLRAARPDGGLVNASL